MLVGRCVRPIAAVVRRVRPPRLFAQKFSVLAESEALPAWLNLPRTIHPYLNLLHNKRVLIIGDGDFSFSRAIAEYNVCKVLHTSTLETPENLRQFYPSSSFAIRKIHQQGGRVLFRVDACSIKTTVSSELNDGTEPLYDVVLWNFPHVPGKQNIRYNRELLVLFLQSAPSVLSDDGCVLVTLVGGQSGFVSPSENTVTNESWNQSWKLMEQVGKAGLLITEQGPFAWQTLPHYQPLGRLGNRGWFDAKDAEYFRIQKPGRGRQALQAPLFSHEVHLWLRHDQLATIDLDHFETSAKQHIEDLLQQTMTALQPDVMIADKEAFLQSLDVVDVYRGPKDPAYDGSPADAVVVLQWTMTAQRRPWDRDIADRCRVIVEEQLPHRLSTVSRSSRVGTRVSQALPWYVTQELQALHRPDTTAHAVDQSDASANSPYASKILLRRQQLDIASAFLRNESQRYQPSLTATTTDETSKLDMAPYGLWQRRVGILLHRRSFD